MYCKIFRFSFMSRQFQFTSCDGRKLDQFSFIDCVKIDDPLWRLFKISYSLLFFIFYFVMIFFLRRIEERNNEYVANNANRLASGRVKIKFDLTLKITPTLISHSAPFGSWRWQIVKNVSYMLFKNLSNILIKIHNSKIRILFWIYGELWLKSFKNLMIWNKWGESIIYVLETKGFSRVSLFFLIIF